MAEAGCRRHDLLDVAPEAWAALLATRPDLDGVPHLAGWARAGRPVILRRRGPGEAAAALPVGLPLPPGDGKRRIGFLLEPGSATPRPPVTLAAARRAVPDAWQPTCDALIALGAAHGIAPCVFGGLLWQALTGLPYLTGASDLDLLWPVTDAVDRRLLTALAEIEARAPMRLDGEIVLPDGFGLNWREIHAAEAGGPVLARSVERMDLRALVVGPDDRLVFARAGA
ncbi:malonate decarboxylase holo-[acyl-carrier-protein] synthase [Methylobacterium sp. BTF04]|uniref:malonate decarboxylase holo-[acyl-carrier-protein] synthase n=1 Tax=Methylobacterium sp. BTF04 TaxID=2708300 RepID=UPI0013D2D3AD|nr:malonate decarboxylase holo-[acyl-carrier-protein] synthase [Methylobacterium sp. BTF04]